MKRGGRPRLDAESPTTQITVYLSVKQLDALCREAHHARVSVPELIRRKMNDHRVNESKTRLDW